MKASDDCADGGIYVPLRSCVACRARSPKSSLLRLVLQGSPERLVPDLQGCAPGRGAWIHRSKECFDLARKKRAFDRAFKVYGVTRTLPDNVF